MRCRCLGSVILTLSVAAAPAFAQSLGELARQEEARRVVTRPATRTYSNASLKPGEVIPTAEDTPTASCYMSKREGKCVTADALIANTEANFLDAEKAKQKPMFERDAANIRDEALRLRQELSRLYTTVEDEGRPANQRAVAQEQIGLKQPLLDHLQQRWNKLEKRVTDLNYPRQWLEPVPDFSSSRVK